MSQKEVLLVDKGQLRLRGAFTKVPKAIRIGLNYRKNMFIAFSEFLAMSKGEGLRDRNLSYFINDVFENQVEEKFVSVMQPSNFFKEKIMAIKEDNPNIDSFVVDCQSDIITFKILLKQPDWDLEELIYDKYRELLNQYKEQTFDIKVREIFK